jgi:hypothetical protein
MPPQTDFPAAAVAELLGLTDRRLRQLAGEGWIPKGDSRGTYPLIGAVQGYLRYLQRPDAKAKKQSDHERLARAQAVKVEMENYRRAGELVLRAHVFELVQTLLEVYDSCVADLAARDWRASEIAASSDAAWIRATLQDEIRAIRTKLADALEDLANHFDALADAPEAPVSE